MYMPRFNADVQRPKPKEETPMSTIATTTTVTPSTQNPNQPQQRRPRKK